MGGGRAFSSPPPAAAAPRRPVRLLAVQYAAMSGDSMPSLTSTCLGWLYLLGGCAEGGCAEADEKACHQQWR